MQIVNAQHAAGETPHPPELQQVDTSFHATLLLISIAVVMLSALLRVQGDRNVIVPVLEIPLPGVCTSQRFFGLNCPGCGLTRSFVSLGHGDIQAAWRFNPAGILGFMLVAAQVPYRSMQLIRVRNGLTELKVRLLGQVFFWAFFGLLLIQWIGRMLSAS
jgi:hypothetical protein